MAQSFIDFVANKKATEKSSQILAEAFQEQDVDKAMELIEQVLKKHINNLVPIVGYVDTIVDGNPCVSKQFLVLDKENPYRSSAFQFNWLIRTESSEVYSIDFFKDASDVVWNGTGKSDLHIKTMGSSIVYFLPIVWTVIASKKFTITNKQALDVSQQVFKDGSANESIYYIGALQYHIFEGLSNNIIEETFNIHESELSDWKKAKRAEAVNAYNHRKDSDEAKELNKRLWKEYNEIINAIRGGASTIEEVQMSIGKGVDVKVKTPKTIEDHEHEIEERKDPEQIFKEMQKYVKMVTKGLQPSLIICGAPGVGKTYKVTKQLRAAGYVEGNNMSTIKGKCTPRRLYVELYDFKKKGDILLIDDADALVGPKAPEDSINILKAALDSTSSDEGRLVNYGIAGKLTDDEGIELPKKFYYNGGVIILTNYRAGQLDSALRGRSFIQDIDFNNGEVLQIIHKLLPDIEPAKYSMTAKQKAYDYLVELNEAGSEMELSLRTFGICAKMYQTAEGDEDFTEADVRSMIREQMKLQAAKGGIKY